METTGSFIKNCKRGACVVTLLVLIAIVPAWADVNITAAQYGDPCDGRVEIIYDATTETNLIRAFALDIRLDNDANIVSVMGLSADYWIYFGTIVIAADGTITSYGTIAAEYGDLPGDTLPGPPDGNGVTLEAASLYAPVGPGSPNAPAKSGVLAEIVVDKSTCLTISANVPRAGSTGVIMENPDEVVTVKYPDVCLDVNVHGIEDEDCLMDTDPGYNTWVLFDRPDCWCYCHQCHGDSDGLGVFGRCVTLSDLNCLKACFGKTVTELLAIGPNAICCDFDHVSTFGRPCGLSDLNILKANFGVLDLPACCPHIREYKASCGL